MYPDDLLWLEHRIEIRKIGDEMRQLSITSNPHLKQEDSKKLPENLRSRYLQIVGVEVNDAEFDPKGIEALKKRLGQESSSIGVK